MLNFAARQHEANDLTQNVTPNLRKLIDELDFLVGLYREGRTTYHIAYHIDQFADRLLVCKEDFQQSPTTLESQEYSVRLSRVVIDYVSTIMECVTQVYERPDNYQRMPTTLISPRQEIRRGCKANQPPNKLIGLMQ